MAYDIFTQYCENCGAKIGAPMLEDARVTCRSCGQLTIVSYARQYGTDDPPKWTLWRISESANETLRAMGI